MRNNDSLNSFIKEGLDIKFTIPAGGMALWVDVGKNAENISTLAKEKGLYLLAENAFHLDNKNNQDKYIRLGFAGQSEEKIHQGLLLLKPLLNLRANTD